MTNNPLFPHFSKPCDIFQPDGKTPFTKFNKFINSVRQDGIVTMKKDQIFLNL